MKALFKYAFLNGLYVRGIVFAVIFTMNTIFMLLGVFGLLPFAANVTAVSLGGVAIALMFAVNIIGDVSIARRMYHSPDAYVGMLAPIPRWKMLFTSVITMTIMDVVTMATVIYQEVWLSFKLAGTQRIMSNFIQAIQDNPSEMLFIIWSILMIIAGYLLLLMIIFFCVTVEKSIFYKMKASGLLTFLSACGLLYILSLPQAVFIPFGTIERFSIFFLINLSGTAVLPIAFFILLLEAAVLFYITSKLMERRINL